MYNISTSDDAAIENRADYILGIIAPRSYDLRPFLEAYRSILLNTPALQHELPEIYHDAQTMPVQQFMLAVLSSACGQLARAEQNTGTRYADDKLYDKVYSDLSHIIVEMTEIERGSQSMGRAH